MVPGGSIHPKDKSIKSSWPSNTRIVFITRLFSGLFECIQDAEWKPTGIPTLVHLAEKISEDVPLTWLLVCRNSRESSVVDNRYRHMNIRGIDFHILPFRKISPFDKINALFTDITAILCYSKMVVHGHDTMVYADAANVVIAAILKRFFRQPTILRMLGIKTFHKRLALETIYKFRNAILFWAYKSPFDHVICTQDGSGVEFFLRRLIRSNVSEKIILNGVRNIACSQKRYAGDVPKLLFTGKLEEEKGILELIDAACILIDRGFKFHLKIVGKGYLMEGIRQRCRRERLNNSIELVGSVGLREMDIFYMETNIYISLNKLGNLSNTVLESMGAGNCIVILSKSDTTHTDEFTERVIPNDAVIRIDRKNIVADLVDKLSFLLMHPKIIDRYSEKMNQFARRFLWLWNDRIDYEISLIRSILRKTGFSELAKERYR